MVATFGEVMAQSEITNKVLSRQKRTISISFDVESNLSALSNKVKEVITPYLYNGVDTLWLNSVEVYGKNRYKRERQVNHINGDKRWELGQNQVMKGSTLHYNYKGGVKPWMAKAVLSIKRSVVGCSKCEVVERNERLAEANLFVIPPFQLDEAPRRWDFGQDELAVKFKVSKVDVDHSIFDNEETFSKILSAVDKIHSSPYYKIDKIQVSGFASPEGSLKFNTWLGENRAKALIDYIIAQRPNYGLTYENFEVVNGEENWSELRELLLNSTLAKREAVVAIIDNTELSREAKKSRIKSLDGGRTWNRMLKEIYPYLRSARYLALYYDSTNDGVAEIINKANAMIEAGKSSEAYKLAMTVANDERAYNTIGVTQMVEGRLQEALTWFERAVKHNSSAAQKNIEAIDAEYGLIER